MTHKALEPKLTALVADFGYDEVRKALTRVKRAATASKKRASPSCATADRRRPSRPRPNAIAVVSSLNLTDAEKQEFLLARAKDYEDKLFMPHVAHARGFLARHTDKDLRRVKSRQQVTSLIFRTMAQLDMPTLRLMHDNGMYGPPKRLATYAEAIAGFSAARRGGV